MSKKDLAPKIHPESTQNKNFSSLNFFHSEELVILKCLIYKNSNALKSFKFFKSLKYCLRRFESVNLIRRDNRTDKSTVRLEPDVIQKLGNVAIDFHVRYHF